MNKGVMDLTKKYLNMIMSFECDFALASDNKNEFSLIEIQEQINDKSNLSLLNDIELLKELSFGIRHNKIMIIGIE